MNNDAKVEAETKPLLEILGGFRVSSLGQVELCLRMTQASQLNPHDPQLWIYFSLKPVSELKLIASGHSSAETGFLPILGRLASTPCHFKQVASVGHSHTPAPRGHCKSTKT